MFPVVSEDFLAFTTLAFPCHLTIIIILDAKFGFLSMGHEIDKYPKGRILSPKDWNWFLEEIKNGSDDGNDDDVSSTGRKSRGGGGANKKRKKKKKERIKMNSGLLRARLEKTPYRDALV
jgi:hypothetical protein